MAKERDKVLQQMACDAARIGGWELDLSTGRIAWSDEACRMHDVPAGASLTLEEALRFFRPEWRETMRQDIVDCACIGAPFDRHTGILTASRDHRCIRVIGRAARDEAGRIVRIQGAFQEMTDEVCADIDSARASRQLRELCDALPQIIWMAQPDGTVNYLNHSADAYTGMPISERSASWTESLHPDDVAATLRIWHECVRTGASYSTEFRIRSDDGAYRWHLASATPAKDEHGDIIRWYGTAIDIHDRKLAEQRMDRLATRLQDTLRSMDDAFLTLDREWRFTYANKQAHALLNRWREDLPGKMIWTEFPELAGSIFYLEFLRAFETGEAVAFEEFCEPLGLWIEARAYPSEDGLVISLRDISTRKEAEHQLKLAAIGFAHVAEGLVVVDPRGRIVSVNPAFTRMTGYTLDEVIGRAPRELLHAPTGRHDDAFFRQIATAANSDDFWEGEIWCRRKNGEVFPQLLSLATVRDEHGHITNHVAVFNDITKLKEQEERLHRIAHRDPLTQLPNRSLLIDRLQHALAAHKRSGNDGALLFIDLDNFKMLNDGLGHDKGDVLLQLLASRLTSAVRESDTVARLGGDEFVVMIEGLSPDRATAMHQVKTMSEKLVQAVTQPYQIGGHLWPLTVSIGITLFSDGENKDGEVLKRADLAMYQAKGEGRNTVRFFDSAMQAEVRARAVLQEDMRRAVDEQEFVLHYQPQVGRDERVAGAEALLRWPRGQQKEVSPAGFIRLAEETGLILPLGRWVLETACAQLACWSSRPETSRLTVAVNVSARQFRDPGFEKLVLEVLERTGADPGKLKLELTESTLIDDVENTALKMRRLKARGLSFSLDDFGTGYSSLSYLRRLPLDQLKIDRSFVKDILADANAASICCTIIALGKNLGLEVIAEGVETEEQRDFLKQHGCHAYQGYLFGRPLPIEELPQLLAGQGFPPAGRGRITGPA